jgi:hypothetical protein
MECVTYVIAARIVGNFFPLSVFDMYQARAPEVAARVLAIDAAGRTAELHDFEAFACDERPLSLAHIDDTCGPDHRPLEYVTRDQELYIEAHVGDAGDESIAVVSRAYSLSDPGVSDCVIAHCMARRRGEAR